MENELAVRCEGTGVIIVRSTTAATTCQSPFIAYIFRTIVLVCGAGTVVRNVTFRPRGLVFEYSCSKFFFTQLAVKIARQKKS